MCNKAKSCSVYKKCPNIHREGGLPLCENPSSSPLPCGDGPQRYLIYPPNVIAYAFVFHVRPHPSETHGSHGIVPRLSTILTSLMNTIVVLAGPVLKEAAVGPNSQDTKEKRGCPLQQLNKLEQIAIPKCSCHDKACYSQANNNDE